MDAINVISKVDGLPDAPVVDINETFQPAAVLFARVSLAYLNGLFMLS